MSKFTPKFEGDTPFAAMVRKGMDKQGVRHGLTPADLPQALYYIRAESHDGDADGPTNLDLFVWAQLPGDAVRAWTAYYKGGFNDPDGGIVKVYNLTTAKRTTKGVLPWKAMNYDKFRVKL